MKQFLLGFAACYLLLAAVAGLAMQRLVPALNFAGAAYVGLTYPAALWCGGVMRGACSIVTPDPKNPGKYSWMFDFDADPEPGNGG